MLVGHVAVGMLAKRAAPKTSLGTFVLAALAADLLWCLFLIAGIERVQIVERGATLMTSRVVSEISWSHSLLMDAVWGATLAAAYFWRRRSAAAVLFAAVLSHWLLDFVSHKPDMPILPGSHRALGLGLWTSVPATLIVEGGLWLLAVILHWRGTSLRTGAPRYVFGIGVLFLTAAWYNNIAGPPPSSNMAAAGLASLVFFSLTVLWAFWIDRPRLAPSNAQPR